MFQVIQGLDLAGRMPGECKFHLIRRYSASVVSYAAQAQATALRLDFNPLGPGIETVLEQFLDHGRGSLDHLAGSDLIDELSG